MGNKGEVIILSKHTIVPSPRTNQEEEEENPKRIHLSPWDLNFISTDYVQIGLLFHKPTDTQLATSSLLSSFSAALDYFYPLAGRLLTTTTNHAGDDHSLSISINCTDQGAEFVQATALHVTVSDILTPYYVPPIVLSFFPRGERLLNYDGHTQPLLLAQVTELADGIFISVTLNHAVADGASFWHFFNTWSKICRTGDAKAVDDPPVFERGQLPIRLPFRKAEDFIKRVQLPAVNECFFHFPEAKIAKLKSRLANRDIRISSLQSVLAHVWRSVTRARGLGPTRETTHMTMVGFRSRLDPPLPHNYFGNSVLGVSTKASACDLLAEKGLGWAALQLNRTFASQDEARAREWIGSWIENPSFMSLDRFGMADVATGGSPRFDVYGNDFGWGRPVAVRNGRGSKVDGKVTVYPGPETGSMGMEVCLSPETLAALLRDGEFMELVG